MPHHRRRTLFAVPAREIARVNRVLRGEFAAGLLVMGAALVGFVAANSPLAEAYSRLRDTRIGPAAWHLDLTLGGWAADGLLAIFFFTVGLELKREFAHGALSRFSVAIVPVAAALGGVAAPALIYLALNAGTDAARGWAIPTATDIAFAVAVLGLVAPRIPPLLRVFLLTLAVVDDFVAIAIIAVFYSADLRPVWLAAALVPLALYALLAQRRAGWFAANRWAAWIVLLPLGAVVWGFVHASGVHATVAGVLLAFAVPVAARDRRSPTPDTASSAERIDLAETFGFRFGPLSSGFAVPVFAFFAAGVSLSGASGFPGHPIALGVLLGLVVGKPLGIVLTALLFVRLTGTELGGRTRDLIGVGCLAGIGFTVALLVAELSFADGAQADTARLAVMAASLLSALLAAVLLVRPRRVRAE